MRFAAAERNIFTSDSAPPGPQSMLRLAPLNPVGVVMAGFQDCTEEALRYLIEVEKLALDDPLVVGLRDHLYEKQKSLDVASVLAEQCSDPTGQDPREVNSFHNQGPYTNLMEFESREETNYSERLPSYDPVSESSLDSENMDTLPVLTPLTVCASRDGDSAIRCLAEEILSLLAEGGDFFDDEDDDDDEDSDTEAENSIEAVEQ